MDNYNPVLFKDRIEAGQKLGWQLKKLNLKNPLILAIPSGGIPVGIEVAKILKCPFDLVIVRKIQFPWTTEAGFGAIAADGTLYLGSAARELPQEVIKTQTKKAAEEAKHREKEFLKRRKKIDISGKTVVLIDDGLAAGSTMLVAVSSIRKRNPAKIIIAVPTASGAAVALLEKEVDQLVALYKHPAGFPFAVASSYQNWHDLTDEEVKNYLKDVFRTGHTKIYDQSGGGFNQKE